jgi:hypothetical protein
MIQSLVVIFGLIVFEIISSVDNAIVNANVLQTVPECYRKVFLFWGLLFAVFLMRGLLPFVIVWLANAGLPIGEVVGLVFSEPERMNQALEHSKPLLLLGGGVYLFFVFLAWLFLEEKKYAFFVENFIHRQGVWFYAISSVFITTVISLAVNRNPMLALAASIGATAFFVTDGFRRNAEEGEKKLHGAGMSAWSKLIYLEVLDASFSIDGVIGAFAFTLSVPLILIGNGIGAVVVRQITVKGIDAISKFAYLKNGAMYSIGMLGGLMVFESFGKEFAFWIAPLNTVALLAIFLGLSVRETQLAKSQGRVH